MKKILWFLLTLCLASLCVGFVACGNGGSGNGLIAPENLKMKNAVLSWSKVEGADSYGVSTDGESFVSVQKTDVDLLELIDSTSVTKVYVRAQKGNAVGKTSEFSLTVERLSAPKKAETVVDEVTHLPSLVWEKTANSNKFAVSVNDGKWVTYSKNSFTPTVTGEYTVVVKCSGYSGGNVLYLESSPSEKSEVLSFVEGPVLSVGGINEICWETSEPFDSFNLYVNGKKARENVQSPLNLVQGDLPVLTKTGEYGLQIEGVRDGVSAWSNYLEEVGTSNINEKEIYSFDNRICNMSLPKEVQVTDERFYGEDGYSLKVNGIDQLNLVRYAASGINEIDFTKVETVSYQIYVEPIEGYTYDYVPNTCVPAIKYDSKNTHSFAKESKIRIGQWVKVTIDCSNEFENVLILSFHNKNADNWPDGIARDFTMYIDDISYEAVEKDLMTDHDYKIRYSALDYGTGAWTGSNGVELDFGAQYAGKEIWVNADLAGTANASHSARIGFAVYSASAMSGNDFLRFSYVDVSAVSAARWQRGGFIVQLNDAGKCYVAALCHPENNSDEVSARYPFEIYLKNVTADTEVFELSFPQSSVDGGSWTGKEGVVLDFGSQYAGKEVRVTADVFGTANAGHSAKLGFAVYSSLTPDKGAFAGFYYVNKEAFASKSWTQAEFTLKLNQDGKCCVALLCQPQDGIAENAQYAYEITMKNVRCEGEVLKFNYDKASSGAWMGSSAACIDKGVSYANKKVLFSAYTFGTADASKKMDVGFACFGAADQTDHKGWVEINAANLSENVSRSFFELTFNAEGKCYLFAICKPTDGKTENFYNYEFSVYGLKEEGEARSFAYTAQGGAWFESSGMTLEFGADKAGKAVTVEMEVCVTSFTHAEITLDIASLNGSEYGGSLYKQAIARDQWTKISFSATADGSGNVVIVGSDFTGNCIPYKVYVKNVSVQ